MLDKIGRTRHNVCAVPYKLVRSFGIAFVYLAGNCKKLSSLRQGTGRRYKRATALSPLNDHNALTKSADDPVSLGEISGERSFKGRILTDHRSLFDYLLHKSRMLLGINYGKPTAKHRNGSSTCGYDSCGANSVNAQRHSADNNGSCGRKLV